MTKKHFEKIAEILNESGVQYEVVERFIDYFEEENSNFNREKFVEKVLGR